MTKKELKSLLREKPGYLKSGAPKLSSLFEVSIKKARKAVREVKNEMEDAHLEIDEAVKEKKGIVITVDQDADLFEQFLDWKRRKEDKVQTRKRILSKPYQNGNKDNVLVIGDLHEPFCLIDYLYFCREQQEKYDCGTVIFIGDVIDNHYSSYHESELDTLGPNEEFDITKEKIQEWYKVFPNAWVTIGNHDRMVHRKCKTMGISSKWVKDYDDALDTPGWKFVDEVVINGVCYNHGEGGTAKTRMKSELISQVQGHLHSQAYVEYGIGAQHRVFGMQVGCGIDRKAFAFAYGKNGRKPFIGCGIVLDKGQLPLLIPMNLK